MEVRSLLPNKVTITERNPNQQPKAQPMNTFDKIFSNPSLLWTIATILVMLCVFVSFGVKVMCTILAIWITVSLAFYYIRRYGS